LIVLLTIKPILEDQDMNKSELIEAVASEADLSKADATRVTDAVLDSISKALRNGDQVAIVGFGTFSVRERAARTGRNPQTGETINIKASKTPGFKAGKALKDAVN
jgi:DNA-binding protein HU-beta